MAEFTPKPLIQQRPIMLDPPPDGNVIYRQTVLRHDLFQIAVTKRIPQVPTHAEHDNDIGKVSPAERRWSGSAHRITLPRPLEPVCNTSLRGRDAASETCN